MQGMQGMHRTDGGAGWQCRCFRFAVALLVRGAAPLAPPIGADWGSHPLLRPAGSAPGARIVAECDGAEGDGLPFVCETPTRTTT